MSEPAARAAGGELRARALGGAMWMASAAWAVRLLSTVTFVVVGRQLDPTSFGVVALANAFVTLLGLLTDSGFATYLVRAPTITRRLFSTGFWTSAVLGCGLAGVLVLIAPLLAQAFQEPLLGSLMQWFALIVLLNGLTSAPQALMRREFRFRQLSVRTLIGSVIASVVAIVMALAGAGVWALVVQSLTSSLISTVLVWWWAPWRPSWTYARADARKMLGFGSQLLLTDLLLQARDRGEEFTLGIVGGAAVLGQWAVASKLVKLVQDSGTQVVNQVSTPALARLQDDPDRLHRGYAASMAAAGALLFPVMGYLALMSRDLIPEVMGGQWTSTAPVASIIALTACFSVFSYFDRPMFAIADRLRVEIVLVVIIVGMHLAVTLVFARFGLVVLALAILARTVATLPLRQWALHRFVGVPYRALTEPLRVLAAAGAGVSAAAAVAVLLISTLPDGSAWMRLGMTALTMSAVYGVALRSWSRETFDAFAGVIRGLARRLRPGAAQIGGTDARAHRLDRHRAARRGGGQDHGQTNARTAPVDDEPHPRRL